MPYLNIFKKYKIIYVNKVDILLNNKNYSNIHLSINYNKNNF